MSVLFAVIFCLAFIASAVLAQVLISLFPSCRTYILVGYLCSVITAVVIISLIKIYDSRTTLKKEKKKLDNIIKNINSMVIVWSDDFSYISVNDAFIRATGYSAEELAGNKELLMKVLPSEAFSRNMQAIINSRDEEFSVAANNRPPVSTIWTTSIVYKHTDRKEMRYLLMSIGPDLTETINMKNELMRYAKEISVLEKKYTLSMDLSEIGIILKEVGSDCFYVSEQLRRMLGFETDSITEDELRLVFHPNDKIVFDTIMGTIRNGDDDSFRDIHYAEFRAQTHDMTYHWFQLRYKTVPHEDIAMANMGGAILDITREKEKDSIIEKMAYIDDVTGIYNRNKFMMTGEEMLNCVLENKDDMNYWIIVIDIDSFHIINDTCGYTNGNVALKRIAEVITDSLTEGGFAARIGGDNFAILIKADGDNDLPEKIIGKIQEDISAIHAETLDRQGITCSAGFCMMTDGGSEFSAILDRAEFALSLSDGTRSSIIRYDNSVHDRIIKNSEIEKQLDMAIDNGELALYYQPKVDLNTGEVMGMEALIRWIKPDGRIVPPGDFIPIAEHSMLITKISRFVLYEACRQNKKWQDMGLRPVTVSINLTAIDFYQTDVTEIITDALNETELDPEWLDVELTESLALKDIDHAIEQMNEIKSLGVKLSMDDFGTGYSSLSYIQVLPISLLKLDRSFIMYLEDDPISREIVSAVIRIAKSKKIETIAEGIETWGQAQILKSSGCDWAQGYFFGKPMSRGDFEKFLILRQKEPAKV